MYVLIDKDGEWIKARPADRRPMSFHCEQEAQQVLQDGILRGFFDDSVTLFETTDEEIVKAGWINLIKRIKPRQNIIRRNPITASYSYRPELIEVRK